MTLVKFYSASGAEGIKYLIHHRYSLVDATLLRCARFQTTIIQSRNSVILLNSTC